MKAIKRQGESFDINKKIYLVERFRERPMATLNWVNEGERKKERKERGIDVRAAIVVDEYISFIDGMNPISIPSFATPPTIKGGYLPNAFWVREKERKKERKKNNCFDRHKRMIWL